MAFVLCQQQRQHQQEEPGEPGEHGEPGDWEHERRADWGANGSPSRGAPVAGHQTVGETCTAFCVKKSKIYTNFAQ